MDRFGIRINNMDIQNTMGFTGPETKDKKIALVITRSGKWLGEEAEGTGDAGGSTRWS